MDDPNTTVRRPRVGRSFAWIAILALMVGLTAFYQALIPERGGMVESTGQGGSARALGLEFGPRTMVMTAAGPVSAWKRRVASVSAGNLERSNVRATITPGLGGEALLGMSFLRHYSIRQQGERLVIESPGSTD